MSDKRPVHKRPDPCKHLSCELQKCLMETNYQMSRCQPVQDAMIECCRLWREKSFVCEGFMWMFKDLYEDKPKPGSDGKT